MLEEARSLVSRPLPGWRNWQTRQTQNLVLAREWEFDPPSGHQARIPPLRTRESMGNSNEALDP